MRSALESVEGVEKVEVDYANQTATVVAKAGTDPKAMCDALEEAGYGAELKSN